MRLLIPVFSPQTGTWGGLTRSLGVAEAAIARGDKVAFCGSGYVEESLRGLGHRVYPMPAATMLGLPRPLSRRIKDRAQQHALPIGPGRSVGSIWTVLAATGMARARYLRRLVDAQLHAAADFRAEALFADLDPGAYVTAAIARIPIASAYSQVMTGGTGGLPWALMRRAMAAVLEDHGLPPRRPEELFFGPHVLKIVPSVPELDDADPARPDVLYAGSLLGRLCPQSLAGSGFDPVGRHVFVYVGTGSVRLETLRRVLPALFPAGGEVTCVVAAQSVTTPFRLAGVRFSPYVDAEALLPRCDWMICHAGQNSIVRSLRHGVPLIMFPGAVFERRYNAQHVAAAGAGVMGESDQFTPAWLSGVLRRREDYRERAEELGERMNACGGAPAAVEAIAAHALVPGRT
ncbi:hypothetical protein MF672_001275 [Actinomadura sp. ATCC 31491]|uniref:Erythromycin biosynthesis protein CIII-like C-terminal domain-containing protein n=1 Tax=Actinomadura luzonensis TaxID=2805427 RepID=A0ABT0FJG0_9ACTN|nr:nucleotide disphospho-sugar-binding domain-containing protein [Actinomadura luzonensis]MCK2212436.1 hypothetical protein [Actinomadura luzonensis]